MSDKPRNGDLPPCCPVENPISYKANFSYPGWYWCESDGDPHGYASTSRVHYCPNCGEKLPE